MPNDNLAVGQRTERNDEETILYVLERPRTTGVTDRIGIGALTAIVEQCVRGRVDVGVVIVKRLDHRTEHTDELRGRRMDDARAKVITRGLPVHVVEMKKRILLSIRFPEHVEVGDRVIGRGPVTDCGECVHAMQNHVRFGVSIGRRRLLIGRSRGTDEYEPRRVVHSLENDARSCSARPDAPGNSGYTLRSVTSNALSKSPTTCMTYP